MNLASGTETWDLEEWEFPPGGVWTLLMAVGGAVGPSHVGNSGVHFGRDRVPVEFLEKPTFQPDFPQGWGTECWKADP